MTIKHSDQSMINATFRCVYFDCLLSFLWQLSKTSFGEMTEYFGD